MLLVSQFLLSHENNNFFSSHLFTHCDPLLPSPLKPSGIAITSESQKGSFPLFLGAEIPLSPPFPSSCFLPLAATL